MPTEYFGYIGSTQPAPSPLVLKILEYGPNNGFDWASLQDKEQEEKRKRQMSAYCADLEAWQHYMHEYNTNVTEISEFLQNFFSKKSQSGEHPNPALQKLHAELTAAIYQQMYRAGIENLCEQNPMDLFSKFPQNNKNYYALNVKQPQKAPYIELRYQKDSTLQSIYVRWNNSDQAASAAQEAIRWYFATHTLETILKNYAQGRCIAIRSDCDIFCEHAEKYCLAQLTTLYHTSDEYAQKMFSTYAPHSAPNFDGLCQLYRPTPVSSHSLFSDPYFNNQGPSVEPSAPPLDDEKGLHSLSR